MKKLKNCRVEVTLRMPNTRNVIGHDQSNESLDWKVENMNEEFFNIANKLNSHRFHKGIISLNLTRYEEKYK